MTKHTYVPRHRIPIWLCLLLIMVGAVLLTACGGSPSSASAVPAATSIAHTPVTGGTTPTPTAVQPTPVRGSSQLVMIIDESNGSYGFNPGTLTIRVGTTLTWKNVSSVPHTVTSDDGTSFDSGTVSIGGTFRFTFKTAGTFSYHCNYHPYMRATIIVV